MDNEFSYVDHEEKIMQTNQIKYYTRSDLALEFRERNKEQHKLRKHKRDYPALFLAWRSLLDEYEKGHYLPFSALAWDIPAWAKGHK